MNAGLYGKICVMPAPHSAPVPTLAEAAQWAPERVVALAQAHEDLQRQVQTASNISSSGSAASSSVRRARSAW